MLQLLTQLCLRKSSFLNEKWALQFELQEKTQRAGRREGDAVAWAANSERGNSNSKGILPLISGECSYIYYCTEYDSKPVKPLL